MRWNDVTCATRALRKRPALATTSIAVLALALGFNISAFSIVNGLLIRPYPYPLLDRLVIVRDRRLAEGAHQGRPIASGDFVSLRRESTTFDGMAAFRAQALVLSGSGDPERIEGAAVSANFFDVVGARTVLGRTFAPDEDTAGRNDRVVLSHRYWKNRFGLDPQLVGRSIMLNGRATTVVGIIPDDNCYPPGVDAWVPLVVSASEQVERVAQRVRAIARLEPGASAATGRGDVERIARRLAVTYPDTNRNRGFDLQALRTEQYEFTGPLFLMVQTSALLVLCLGAANVVNLLMAGTIARQREFGVRFALGASRANVFMLMVIEAVMVAIAGGLAALMAARWSLPLIHAALPEGIARWIAGWQSINIDATVATAAVALTLITGAGLGCGTGWYAVRAAASGLRDAGRSGAPHLTWIRRSLIVGEIVLAMALLLASAATLRGFRHLSLAFGGLAPQDALRFNVSLPPSRYPDDTHVVEFQNRLLDGMRALPGVSSVGLIRNEPASNVSSPLTAFVVEGRAPLATSEMPRADLQTISPGAFDALRLRVRLGRTFRSSDSAASARVAVISEEMARRFWPVGDPVGSRLRVGEQAAAWTTIVGVVADMTLNWYDPTPRPTVYLAHTQTPSRQMYVLVRATVPPLTLAAPIRAIGQRLDPMQPLSGMQRVDEVVAESISPVRVLGLLLLIAGALAMVFTATGVYGVLGHWVTSRSRELGIRIALGASPGDLSRLVLRQGTGLALVGLAIGTPASLAALALLRSRLFDVVAVDAPTVLVVATFVLAVAALAALVPARRAAHADPAILLQSP